MPPRRTQKHGAHVVYGDRDHLHTTLRSVARQYAHGTGLLIRNVTGPVMRLVHNEQARGALPLTAVKRHVADEVAKLIANEESHSPVCKKALSAEFLKWAFTPGQARKDVMLYTGYRLHRVANAKAVWTPEALCSWGTFRASYLPFRTTADVNPDDYDSPVSFVPVPATGLTQQQKQVQKQLQEWADTGRLAEIDVLCSARSVQAPPAGMALLLYVLGDIASRKKAGTARYEGVIASVAYTAKEPFANAPMKRLLDRLGFQSVTVYTKGTRERAKEAGSTKSKEYMMIHNASAGQPWWQRVATYPDLPHACPRASRMGVGMCV